MCGFGRFADFFALFELANETICEALCSCVYLIMICLQMLMNRRARLEAVAIQCDRFIQIREICLLWWSLWTIDVARFTAIFFHFARFCNAFDWRRRQLVWFSISLTHYSVMIFVCASQTRFAYILRLHFIRFESLSRLVLVRTVAANINWLVVGFFLFCCHFILPTWLCKHFCLI